MNLGLHGFTITAAECRRGAIILVSFEMFSEILRLPPGVRVTAIRPRDEAWNEPTAMLRLEGEALPWVHEGQTLPQVMPVYRRADCGVTGHAELAELLPVVSVR